MISKILQKLVLLSVVLFLSSCSPDEVPTSTDTNLISSYNHNDAEIELAKIINDYRLENGLNALETINHISYKSGEHNEYMIANKVVNHDLFDQRSRNLISVLGAVKVKENVAYNYSTPQAALHAWLQSAAHKSNIEGDFTHFGIAISTDIETGKKYFTNIFIKK